VGSCEYGDEPSGSGDTELVMCSNAVYVELNVRKILLKVLPNGMKQATG
jgi:hypothetical protein